MIYQEVKVLDPFVNLFDTPEKNIHLYTKDLKGKYLDSNDFMARACGLRGPEHIRGLTDIDLTFLPNESAALQFNDKRVMCTTQTGVFIEPITLFNRQEVIAVSYKKPLYSKTKKVIGVDGISIIVEKNQFCSFLPSSFKPHFELPQPSIDKLTPAQLTAREIECLYNVVKGKTSKEIGLAMSISSRTVEQHIINCKQKLGCVTRSELIESALQLPAIKTLLFT